MPVSISKALGFGLMRQRDGVLVCAIDDQDLGPLLDKTENGGAGGSSGSDNKNALAAEFHAARQRAHLQPPFGARPAA